MKAREQLQLLHQSNMSKGLEGLPDDPNDPLEAVEGYPLSGDLTRLDDATLTLIFERERRLRKRYPHGEWHYKSGIPYRMYIYPTDVVALRHPKLSLRSAQRLLLNIRVIREKPSDAPVTVKEYCAHTNENEDEVREFLNDLDDLYRKKGKL